MSQHSRVETIAKLLIINDKNEALVLILGKHHKYPEKSFQPDLPGGIVETRESEQIAVIRETKEECGVDITAKDACLIYAETKYYPDENKSVTKLLYLARITNTPQITLSWEHSDYKWIPVGELLESVTFRPFFQEAVRYCVANALI